MKYLVAATLAVSLLVGTTAMADPHDQWNQNQRQDQRYDNGNNNGWDSQDGRWSQGRWDNRGGYGRPHWSQGDRFSHYGRRGWVVNDYRSRHLRRPPHGYHWVESDNDYLLVQITSGIIAQIILGNNRY